jgi:hypothetical protein
MYLLPVDAVNSILTLKEPQHTEDWFEYNAGIVYLSSGYLAIGDFNNSNVQVRHAATFELMCKIGVKGCVSSVAELQDGSIAAVSYGEGFCTSHIEYDLANESDSFIDARTVGHDFVALPSSVAGIPPLADTATQSNHDGLCLVVDGGRTALLTLSAAGDLLQCVDYTTGRPLMAGPDRTRAKRKDEGEWLWTGVAVDPCSRDIVVIDQQLRKLFVL